jgi:hypothetical protein
VNDVAKSLFAVLFLAVRCVLFPLAFRGHWGALIVQLDEGTAHAPLLLYATLVGKNASPSGFFFRVSISLSLSLSVVLSALCHYFQAMI